MSVWIEVKALLPGPPEDWSRWTYIFERHGLLGTVQHDYPPAISAYVPPADSHQILALSDELEMLGATVEQHEVREENWAETWKDFFHAKPVGESWWIRPSWEDAPAPDGRKEIVLDPGQAFGTGEHATTRGCLTLIEQIPVEGKRVADIGCGSGILAVAAGLLGAASVHAVDVEAPSVEAAIENASRNQVVVQVWRGLGFDPLPDGQYDVILSNIISAALIQLAPAVKTKLATDGSWIVSGIIEANWPDVLAAAQSQGFQLAAQIREDDWVTARFHH